MFWRLVLVFTLVPFVELALLIYVGDRIGLLWTIALVLGTGIAGAALAKHQGLRVWRRVRDEVSGNRLPGGALLDGFLILVAGLLLITPGLITDALGFSLLIPGVRSRIRRRFAAFLQAHTVLRFQTFRQGASAPSGDPAIIDTEFTSVGEDDSQEKRR
ncbi:MAG: FxsA family protein [Planctomycetales bacterium]